MFYQEIEFIEGFIHLIKECNEIVLNIYNTDFEVDYKEDESPLTIADKLCNEHICSYLEKLNQQLMKNCLVEKDDILIISEENKNLHYEFRKNKKWCWLVDPIDGTKEFVKKNGEFTVNIGLVEDGIPVFGIVSIPVTGEIYYGIEGDGSFKTTSKGMGKYKIHQSNTIELKINADKNFDDKNVRIVASSSHLNKETQDFIDKFDEPIIISTGSSIKLLFIAEGKADIYPRIAPTSEWDTCAAHAIINCAGGFVLNCDNLTELTYNKENLLNPNFIVL